MMSPINRLAGMRDLTGRAYQRVRDATDSLRAFLSKNRFAPIETPLVEETELFVRKSGGELTSRLYTFTDPGGRRVSLRPEFTSSVIRLFIQQRATLTLPVRWHYSGPVFRYESGERDDYRQSTQVGAEIVGAGGVDADAEVIHLAWEGLNQIGFREGHLVRVGHIGILQDLLGAFGLSESAKLFIISSVHALASGVTDVAALRRRAEAVGLLGASHDSAEAAAQRDMGGETANEFIRDVLKDSTSTAVGRRTPEQIVARLMRKASEFNDPGTFEDALSLVSQLARLVAPAEAALKETRRIAGLKGITIDRFDEMEWLLSELARQGIPKTRLYFNLGLTRGFAYYSGVIFDLVDSSAARDVSVGGGGRYDGLVRALGANEDVPALGFAYNLDQLLDLVDRTSPDLTRTSA